jgi:hypothetical protein
MPTPTIPDGELFFNATLYSGNDANPRAITNGVAGQSFQPDFVWVKQRTSNGGGAAFHQLYDSVRGTQKLLRSNETAAELANPSNGGVQSFDSNGFTIQGSSASLNMNQTGETYVAWQWKAGGAAVTNTAGTISSQVSANTTSGFSVVTYTGNGSAATIGHGLGVAPRMYIVKSRSSDDWVVYHASLPSAANYLTLNTTNAQASNVVVFNSTAPTSTVFSVGTSRSTSSTNFVAYCFAQIAGYSAFGSYTGNGSTDGPFVYLGFRPRFLMIKRTDTGGTDWVLLDSSRDPTNVVDQYLAANLSDAETVYANDKVDFLSNGFKQRGTASGQNGSGGTFIYMAFAENPFKYANAR